MKTLVTIAGAAGVAALLSAAPVQARDLNAPPAVSSQIAPGDLGSAIMSAGINADGTVARGEGVDAAKTRSLGTGNYEVGFGRDITACVYQISAGESLIGGATPRLVGITQRSGNANGVFVQIRDAANALINNPFFVVVYCGR